MLDRRRTSRHIPAPVLIPAHGYPSSIVPVDEMDSTILNAPVGSVFVSGLGGLWWTCQTYSENGDMYVWQGIRYADYESIYNGSCKDRNVWLADWHPLLLVASPEGDLANTFGDPYDEFNQHRFAAMSNWVARNTDEYGDIVIED